MSLKVFCSCKINKVRVRAESPKQKACKASYRSTDDLSAMFLFGKKKYEFMDAGSELMYFSST
jgi:hypothetical protein